MKNKKTPNFAISSLRQLTQVADKPYLKWWNSTASMLHADTTLMKYYQSLNSRYKMSVIPFHVTDLFLYLLKTSGFLFSGSLEKNQWHKMS